MTNLEIKNRIKKENIFMWQIAKRLEIHEGTFCRWFREPLTKNQEIQILSAIEDIKLTRIKEQKNQ